MKLPLTSYGWPLLSGVLMLLATPYVGLWPLTAFALVPFFLHIFSAPTPRHIMIATLLMGIPYCYGQGEALYSLAGIWWGVASDEHFLTASGIYMLGISAIIIFAASTYIFPMFFAKKIDTSSIILPVLLAAGFAFIEFIRSSIFLAGYSWGVMGYLLIDTLYVKHVASLLGVYGLTFLLVFWNAWLAQVVIRYRTHIGSIHTRLQHAFFEKTYSRESIIIVFLCITTLVWGVYREHFAPELKLTMRVAVIASSLRTDESINEGSYHFYRALFLSALKEKPDLLLTPENVFPYFVIDEETHELGTKQFAYLPDASELWKDFLSLTRAYPETTFALATHTLLEGKNYNSILLYRDGKMQSIYHKRKPVPFTEYSPLGFRLNLFETIAKGEDIQDFRIGELSLGGYICSEIGITPLSVHGAKLILSPSNDSALSSETILPLQHQFARMRALEAGAYMLRSSKGGVSGIIDPKGRALKTMSERSGILIMDI